MCGSRTGGAPARRAEPRRARRADSRRRDRRAGAQRPAAPDPPERLRGRPRDADSGGLAAGGGQGVRRRRRAGHVGGERCSRRSSSGRTAIRTCSCSVSARRGTRGSTAIAPAYLPPDARDRRSAGSRRPRPERTLLDLAGVHARAPAAQGGPPGAVPQAHHDRVAARRRCKARARSADERRSRRCSRPAPPDPERARRRGARSVLRGGFIHPLSMSRCSAAGASSRLPGGRLVIEADGHPRRPFTRPHAAPIRDAGAPRGEFSPERDHRSLELRASRGA